MYKKVLIIYWVLSIALYSWATVILFILLGFVNSLLKKDSLSKTDSVLFLLAVMPGKPEDCYHSGLSNGSLMKDSD